MPDKATEVITEVLRAGNPTAEAILGALEHTGYVLLPPSEQEPAWLPSTARSRAKVGQYVQLANKGTTPQDIATAMGVSIRTVERYGAAAVAFGLLAKRR